MIGPLFLLPFSPPKTPPNSGRTLDDSLDGNNPAMKTADGYSNGEPFDNSWRADHITFNNGIMTLQIDDKGCPRACANKPYASGEYRSKNFYGYGTLESRFRAARADGVVSSLFFHTDKNDGNPWDEIDIEILGKDPTKMQINYYTNGVGHHEKLIDLGFDASKDFHIYGIRWTKGSIGWSVDGKLVHAETGTRGSLPSHPSKVMVNLWPGTGVDGWLNHFSYHGPIKAEYDWIRYTPVGVATQTSPAVSLPAAKVTDFSLPNIDLQLGKEAADGRAKLDAGKVIKLYQDRKISLDQLEAVVAAVAGRPANTVLDPSLSYNGLKEFFRYYPELEIVLANDQNQPCAFFRYFYDFREYWGNAILLLSIVVQKQLEENLLDILPETLNQLLKIRQRIETQFAADNASGKKRAPSDYSLTLLNIVESELRAQIKDKDADFYARGIELALQGMMNLLSFESKLLYPSKPDYFALTKTILILGDLYQQLAHLTSDEKQKGKYLQASFQLYKSVADLENKAGSGLSLDLNGLLADPLLLGEGIIDLSPPYSASFGLGINFDREAIDEALSFNSERGFIKAEDRQKAFAGIFQYQKGVAAIKQAGLFAAWPRIKEPQEILAYLEKVSQGVEEIKKAAVAAGEAPDKNRYFFDLAKLVRGELLLSLADRLTYKGQEYPVDPKISERLSHILSLPVCKNNRELANALMTAVKRSYSQGISPDFAYLSVWEAIKQLELDVRTADYVKVEGQNKVLDATEQLNSIKKLEVKEGLIDRVFEKETIPSYLKIEFNYLKAILLLAGMAEKDKRNHYILEQNNLGGVAFKKTANPREVIELIERSEEDLSSLPPASKVYFETYFTLKEVSALIQFDQKKNKTAEDTRLINARIEKKTGNKMKPLDYALILLAGVEKRSAPALPPYLMHNLEFTLADMINGKPIDKARTVAITDVVKLFIDQKIKVYYPESFVEINGLYQMLVEQINNNNPATAATSLKRLVEKIKVLDANAIRFSQEFANLLAWDMETLKAELYDDFAVAYAIKKDGKLLTQYAQSAYIESMRSSSRYDKESRPFFIYVATNVSPDFEAGIQELKAAQRLIFRK